MNKVSTKINLVLCVLGLLVGYLGNSRTESGGHADADSSEPKLEKTGSSGIVEVKDVGPISLPSVRSDQTLETLIAQGDSASYSEMALWLLDASGPDIAAYWEARKASKIGGDMKRLIFINWTRLDPQAAIAATAGTEDAGMPWWSWAAHDPQAALAAAGTDQMGRVARGIGEFQPEWLRTHFDMIPEDARQEALGGMTTWKEDSDHLATLDFLKEKGMGFQSHIFKTLARKDPWAAFDWLEKNDMLGSDNYSRGNSPIDVLLATMLSCHPDDLERLASLTPSGKMKWKFEDAIFENLLASDPAAALEQAKANKTPLIAAKKLAKIGSSLLSTDPDRAFEIGMEIIVICPDKFDQDVRVDTENGQSTWSSEDSATERFIESLLAKDPQKTLEMMTVGSETISSTFRSFAGKWAEQDLVAFTDWVNRQTNPKIRDVAANQVTNQLSSRGHFQEAAEWALSGKETSPGGLYNLAVQWGNSNPEEAAAWVESADLSEQMKNTLKGFIKRNQ